MLTFLPFFSLITLISFILIKEKKRAVFEKNKRAMQCIYFGRFSLWLCLRFCSRYCGEDLVQRKEYSYLFSNTQNKCASSIVNLTTQAVFFLTAMNK